jgi:hypothetical protein
MLVTYFISPPPVLPRSERFAASRSAKTNAVLTLVIAQRPTTTRAVIICTEQYIFY